MAVAYRSESVLAALLLVIARVGYGGAAPPGVLEYTAVGAMEHPPGPGEVVVDTRPRKQCESASLRGAICLGPRDFLGYRGALASFRQIFWVLGTSGIRAGETAIVVGDHRLRRDFVAGVLYLSGQRQIRIVRAPVTGFIGRHPALAGPGRPRSELAAPLYAGRPRLRRLVFRGELLNRLYHPSPPEILDGRSDRRFWGAHVPGTVGGHIPGASSLPLDRVEAMERRGRSLPAIDRGAIAYAANPYTGIAYFTALTAGLHADADVYPGGWVQWSGHAGDPIDMASRCAGPDDCGRLYTDAGHSDEPLDAIAYTGLIAAAVLVITAALVVRAVRRKG